MIINLDSLEGHLCQHLKLKARCNPDIKQVNAN